MKKEFFDFLKSGKIMTTIENDKGSKIIINKVKCNDKLDILYSLYSYNGELFDLSSPFKYSGIYDKETEKLYDVEYGIRFNILGCDYDNDEYLNDDDLYKLISKDVNKKIEEIINESKEDIFNVDNVEIIEEITDYSVIDCFIKGETSKTLKDYYKEYSTTNPKNIINYLSKKEKFLEEEARNFIIDNTTSILKGLAISKEKRKMLKQIEENKEHPYHKIKNIIDVIKDKNCVTINLTINKNNIEQTFKYNADALLHNYDSSYLSSYNIEKLSERNKFEETFGRYADFHYEDIIKITYSKNVLYEDTNFKVKEEEKCLA